MSFIYFSNSKNRPKDPRRFIIKKKGYGPNWYKIRKIALERDNYTCQACGYKGKRRYDGRWDIHIHHIKKLIYFVDSRTQEVDYQAANHLDNLKTLCAYGCHKYYDGHQNNSKLVQLK